MIHGRNTSRVSLSRKRTLSFLTTACTVIDGLQTKYGTTIPDFKAEFVAEMKRVWPYWRPSWVEVPSEGHDAFNESVSMWALIKLAYASHRPGWVVTPVRDGSTRLSGTWRITDDLNEVRAVFETTLEDYLNGFSHHMEGTSLLAKTSFGDDAIMQFFISGAKQVNKELVALWNATVRIRDDISTESVAVLRRRYGWQDANDAIDTLEDKSGVRGRAPREIGGALWQQYDRKVP